MTRENVVNALYLTGAVVAVVAVVFTINAYFGDPDQWDRLRSGFNTITALLALLRDLVVLGLGIAGLIVAIGWLLDSGRGQYRAGVANGLYLLGLAVLVIGVAWAINQYFGKPEDYDRIEAGSNNLTAGLSFVRDLVILGVGLAAPLLGLGWHIDRGSRS
jgi:hypothetical protein